MKVLIGVPTHKRPELLRECLESIAAQEVSLAQIEVFVADNDPKRRAGAMLATELADHFRFPLSSTVVEEPGISSVRNAILDQARSRDADFIVMIDDDETASAGWLSRLLSVQEGLGTGVIGGPVIPVFPESAPLWFRSAFHMRDRATGLVDLVDATGNVLLSCEALKAIGWPKFDPAYGLSGGGDTEFFLRVRDLGVTFGWASDAKVYEPVENERLRTRWMLKRQFRYGSIGNQLSRRYRIEIPSIYWAAFSVAVSPLLLIAAIHPKLRMKALRRIAYAAGLVAGALGMKVHEYATRHRGSNRPVLKERDPS